MLIDVLVCVLAGLGAGIGTGFAGMSAAAVITPMLVAFMDIDPYTAIGIALASDVLASAFSAITYGKNKNLDVKNGLVMMLSVIIFTVIGSYLGERVPETSLGNFSVLVTLIMGIRFILYPVSRPKSRMIDLPLRRRLFLSILWGAMIGMVCGLVGAGGGMMMLLVLTSVLGYELKAAVGTSVFIMTFTALTGSVSHFMMGGEPSLPALLICMASTLLFARLAALVANHISPKTMGRTVGVILTFLSLTILVVGWLA